MMKVYADCLDCRGTGKEVGAGIGDYYSIDDCSTCMKRYIGEMCETAQRVIDECKAAHVVSSTLDQLQALVNVSK